VTERPAARRARARGAPVADPPPPPFRTVETRRPFRGKVLTVRTDRIVDGDGRTGER
jgi:hypothetical protein